MNDDHYLDGSIRTSVAMELATETFEVLDLSPKDRSELQDGDKHVKDAFLRTKPVRLRVLVASCVLLVIFGSITEYNRHISESDINLPGELLASPNNLVIGAKIINGSLLEVHVSFKGRDHVAEDVKGD